MFWCHRLENLHLNIYSLDVAASAGNRRMDSLPEPSETVEDEWAAMKIRFRKEGLDWDRLSDQDRILQVREDKSVIQSCSLTSIERSVHSVR